MSLANYAKTKALNFIQNIYRQADPKINTSVGTAVRATVVLPSALIYSAVFQEIEVLRNIYLGNFSNISEQDMDLLAGLQDRPAGSRSTTTLRIYLENLEAFTLDAFPYFRSINGASYRPIRSSSFNVSDILQTGNEIYVNIPVISTTFGPESAAAAGEINEFNSLPIDVRRVTNPAETQGGEPRLSNAEFFEYLKDTLNDRTINQIGGIREFVVDNYPEAEEVLVVTAGDSLMLRDEVWTSDGVNPNLLRNGEPFAAHRDLGTLNFDQQFGRAVATGEPFSQSDVGERMAIVGDIEKFRTILQVIDSNTIVISGYPKEGSASAKIYGEGPRIQVMSDVYLYFPAIQIQSTIVDKRFFLTTLQDQNGSTTPFTKLYYNISEGFSYTSIASSGEVVVLEGTSQEAVYNVSSVGEDGTGTFLQLESAVTTDISGNSALSFYDMSEIVVGEDILDRPVIYVLQIDQLNPLSFESVTTIPRSTPGTYDDPGWYISNTDPAEVFSAREVKSIVLDEKRGNNAFDPFEATGSEVTDSSFIKTGSTELTSGSNIISKPFDWSNTEGREVTVTYPNTTLQDEASGVTAATVAGGAGTSTMLIDGLNVTYSNLVGYRDDVRVRVFDSGPSLIATYDIGQVQVYGNTLELKVGSFSASADSVDVILPFQYTNTELLAATPPASAIAWSPARDEFFPEDATEAPVFYNFDGSNWVDSTASVDSEAHVRGFDLETVILRTDGSTQIEVLADTGILSFSNASGLVSTLVVVDGVGEFGSFNSNPVRVTYATQSDFGDFQNTLDSGDVQLLAKDTLARSFLPSLIDATIPYSGSSTSEQVFNRFVGLIQEANTEVDSGQRLRLDISNIIAALDEEGLTDSIDVDFEIRVTNFLSDGEFEVRYLNPSESTKQALAIDVATVGGEDRVTLRRLDSTANIPGRGKLFLGGNNPDTQELIPYEAVVDHGDGTFTFVLRGSQTLDFAHAKWETVFVTVRDYDTKLEFTEGAIFIPSINRPYVRQLVVIKQ